MDYLSVNNLSKSFDKFLFKDINFHIHQGDKVALVAKNGAGKSTLLKVLTGEVDRTDGDINRRKGLKIGVLTQNTRFDENSIVIDCLFDNYNEITQTIKEYEKLIQDKNSDIEELTKIMDKMELIKARDYESKLKIIISKLKINSYLHKKISILSGGELKCVALAKVLVNDPDFLILDESTNHLDLEMIEWLENYLKTQNITMLMVTHDRYFLERVCSRIFELDRGKLYIYPGNYSYFLEKKLQRQENENLYMQNLRKRLKQELSRIRKAPRARGSKSVHREKKFYNIEDLYDTNKSIIKAENKQLKIEMGSSRIGTKICKIYNIYKNFNDKKIIEDFSYHFRNNDRIGIIGKNGVGKSTFIRLILGKEKLDSGKITIGETIKFGYYQQKNIKFKDNERVIDVIKNISEYMYIGKNKKISASKALENFLFSPSKQHILANNLSGGEKRRLYLLSVLIENPNFLILDEPTNDLDLITLGILEDFLLHYQGCLVIISHDRFFMDKIVDHLLVFKGEGIIEDFWGTYSEYRKHQKQELKKDKKNNIISKTIPNKINKKKLTYNQKQEIKEIEQKLEFLEKRKEEINKFFNNKNIPYDDIKKLSEELGIIIKNIEQYEYRWLELMD